MCSSRLVTVGAIRNKREEARFGVEVRVGVRAFVHHKLKIGVGVRINITVRVRAYVGHKLKIGIQYRVSHSTHQREGRPGTPRNLHLKLRLGLGLGLRLGLG